MSLIRIVDPSGVVARQLHQESLRENRAVSAMGLILLRESLDARREKRTSTAEVEKLVQFLKSPIATDAA
jgi:hypothetical protein